MTWSLQNTFSSFCSAGSKKIIAYNDTGICFAKNNNNCGWLKPTFIAWEQLGAQEERKDKCVLLVYYVQYTVYSTHTKGYILPDRQTKLLKILRKYNWGCLQIYIHYTICMYIVQYMYVKQVYVHSNKSRRKFSLCHCRGHFILFKTWLIFIFPSFCLS